MSRLVKLKTVQYILPKLKREKNKELKRAKWSCKKESKGVTYM